jgi:serine/threonine-protein kinase
MAEIFLAKQGSASFEGFERFIVIKRILPNLSENEDFVRMFLDEARLAAQLNHPNIVQIYDIGAVSGQYFIAMEYLSGRDCRRLMKKAAKRGELVPLHFALQVVHGVCEGLEYAHDRTDGSGRPLNVVHRDVSPQNVHVTHDGAVKLLDFGIAKASSQMMETRAGVLKGKYSYMSPEQATGARVDRRSDIFSLGILLFEMSTGRRLFKSENEMQTLRAVIEGNIPHPSSIIAGYPPDLDAIVMRALQRPLHDRYQTCRELQGDIEAFMASRGFPQTPARLGAYVKDLTQDEVDPTQLPEVRSASVPALGADGEEVGPIEPLLEGEVDDGLEPLEDVLTRTPSRPVAPDSIAREPSAASSVSQPSAPSDLSQGDASGSRSSLSVLVGQRPALSIGIASLVVALLTAGLILWLVPPNVEGADPIGRTVPPLPPPPRAQHYGTIRVESTPTTAHVVFDGQPVADSTPATLAQVTVGVRHRVVVSVPGQPPQTQEVELRAAGESRTLPFSFAVPAPPLTADGGVGSEGPTPGTPDGPGHHTPAEPGEASGARRIAVTIRTEPPTKVYFDNRLLGDSPVSTRVPPGTHAVRCVSAAQEINFATSVRVPDGAPFATTIAISHGTLRINVLPWANVTVNGRSLGQTPIAPRQVFAGRYQVRIENPQLGKSETRTVSVPANGVGTLAVDWRN